MYIDVKLFSGFSKPLTYHIKLAQPLAPGTIVTVPIRAQTSLAVVIKCYTQKPSVSFAIRTIESIQTFPEDPLYYPFIQKLAAYYCIDELLLIKRLQSFLKEQKIIPIPKTEEKITTKKIELTSEQQAIVSFLEPAISSGTYTPTVVHGVTGSGKTEVYKKLIEHSVKEQKTVLLLLPEVTLAVQFERLLKAQLASDTSIVSFHSATDAQTKKLLWQNALQNKPQVIIGVHLPILLPLKNVGCIIIDEEHDSGFQEKKHPKINTKNMAILRAQQYNIPILLGSATPSVTSLYNVEHKKWHFFELKKRFSGAFPTIKHVLLTDKKQRRSFWISDALKQALQDRLRKKEQSIIFLNRRGVCFFMQCKACAYIFNCTSCSVSLTLHADCFLKCHYCSYKQPEPQKCPQCNCSEFLKKGIGTQQLVAVLEKMFPQARIARADLDTTVNKKLWNKTITAFEKQELDILVGTQTITKGYHFPHVTLVGIIWADSNSNFPFYNAQEVAIQQLIQVAGRAGRHTQESLVIMQTMTDTQLYQNINEQNYLDFYKQELARRSLVLYPPLIRFAEIELKHQKAATVEQESFLIAAQLMKHKNITVLGPALPPIEKIKKIVSRKIYLKGHNFADLQKAFMTLDVKGCKSKLYFTPHPLN